MPTTWPALGTRTVPWQPVEGLLEPVATRAARRRRRPTRLPSCRRSPGAALVLLGRPRSRPRRGHPAARGVRRRGSGGDRTVRLGAAAVRERRELADREPHVVGPRAGRGRDRRGQPGQRRRDPGQRPHDAGSASTSPGASTRTPSSRCTEPSWRSSPGTRPVAGASSRSGSADPRSILARPSTCRPSPHDVPALMADLVRLHGPRRPAAPRPRRARPRPVRDDPPLHRRQRAHRARTAPLGAAPHRRHPPGDGADLRRPARHPRRLLRRPHGLPRRRGGADPAVRRRGRAQRHPHRRAARRDAPRGARGDGPSSSRREPDPRPGRCSTCCCDSRSSPRGSSRASSGSRRRPRRPPFSGSSPTASCSSRPGHRRNRVYRAPAVLRALDAYAADLGRRRR